MKLRNILLFTILTFSLVTYAQKEIVILHTNDTHSRIESLPSSDKNYGETAGVVPRKAFVDKVRQENSNVLLFDVGDFVQGTPYFNLFHGRVEATAMNRIGYDAGTLGNHEFDYGLDTLKMIVKELNFPIVSCNYDFSETPLNGLIKPYIVLVKDGVRIGVLGVGADPEGLIQKSRYEDMIFKPVITNANHYAKILKDKEKCDLIICLSHVGYSEDLKLAAESKNIDIILGGHSHTYMEAPEYIKNQDGKEVMIFQTGKNGTFVGRVDVELEKRKK